MSLSGFIAGRYLFAKKSHNVINIISMISAAGIATGCAALIIILSIYNGFDGIIRSMTNTYTPDLLVSASDGRHFDAQRLAEFSSRISSQTAFRAICPVLEESVYLKYGDRHAVATARGVDSSYVEVTLLKEHLTEGTFEMAFGTIDEVVAGRTLALELGMRTTFLTSLEAYFPSRTEPISPLDPLASLHKAKFYPSGIVALDENFDKKFIFMPLDALQGLSECEGKISFLEIYLTPEGLDRSGIAKASVLKAVEESLPEGFIVKNRRQQNETIYKLLLYEKAAIYAILLFIMIIISCNIFGSLSMLIMEKRQDVMILQSMGATEKFTSGIFVKEGWMISLLGIAVGVVLGLLVCFIQQKFGIVKMPGNFMVDAYPVEVRLSDVLLTVAGVGLIGYLVAILVRKH